MARSGTDRRGMLLDWYERCVGGASFRTGTDQLKKDIGVPRPQFSKCVEETNVPFFLCP